MDEKNVLMIVPTPFFSDRGCHIRVLNSYLRLQGDGHRITLLTYSLGRDIPGIRVKRVVKIPGYKKTTPGFSPFKPLLDLFLLIKAFGELSSGNYDMVYGHLHEGALIGIVLKYIFQKKVIFDNQGSLRGELTEGSTIKKDSFLSKVIFLIEKYITNSSDEIITSTTKLKEFLLKDIGTTRPVTVVTDLPDKSLFNESVEPAILNLPKNKKIIVYLGGLQEYKGIDYLIRAIPLTKDKFHFLIMGYPVERVKELSVSLNIEDRITFTGKIPYELAPSYLKCGDVAVSPKTLESKEANAKIYNYMAMGLKTICFDTPENREILGDQGIYAKEKDIRDLADKINELI